MKNLILTLIITLFIPSATWASEAIGTIIALEGQATILSAENGTTQNAKENTPIHLGDTIETGKNANVFLLLKDNSEFTLSENAEFTIDEYVFTPQTPAKNKARFSALKGAFLLTSGLIAKTDTPDIEINTGLGSIGIRGTVVWGGPLDNQYGILLQIGEVDISNQHGTVTLYPGEGAFIPSADKRPRKIGTWASELTDRALYMTNMKNSKEIRKKANVQKAQNLEK